MMDMIAHALLMTVVDIVGAALLVIAASVAAEMESPERSEER